MTKKELLDYLENQACEYRLIAKNSIKRNKHMNNIEKNDMIEQKVVDAILVDFINYIALYQGVDLGLYTKYLVKDRTKESLS